jgi:hypothetical protein
VPPCTQNAATRPAKPGCVKVQNLGAGLAWSKAAESDRDYLAAFKAHKAELGAGERKGAPLCMQALCVVSPEWVKAAGDLS